MRRACVLPVLAACNFGGPSAGTDGALPDAPTDAADGGECDLDATWEKGKQPSRTVYVSKTPGPGVPDGSELNPFTTLVSAIPAIAPGTRVLLGPGDYAGATITDKRGTAEAPIWIEGPPGGQAARIIGGTGVGLDLVRPQYWVIRNLSVASLTQQPGINIDDGTPAVPGAPHHIIIERVEVGSVDRSCIRLHGVTDVTVRDSKLGSCDRGVTMLGVQRGTIARTEMGGIVTAGVALAAGSAEIEVRQNRIADVQNGLGVWIGGDSNFNEFRPPLSQVTGNTEARNIRVFDNVIRNVRDAVMCSNCTRSLVAHNLIRRVTGHVFRLDQSYVSIGAFQFSASGGVSFLNNAIEIAASADAVRDSNNGTDAASCMFGHNMWLKEGGVWVPALPSAEIMGMYDAPSGYSDTGRLCTSTGSRAAGAGTPLPEVEGTLEGECRPSPPSIGPSEPEGC